MYLKIVWKHINIFCSHLIALFWKSHQMADQQQEHQRETEGLLDSIRELRKELQLQTLLIESFIPPEFQVK